MSLFNVTDQELLNEIQYALLETPNNGASISSGLWTPTEIISYLNDRQRQLLRDTGVVAKTSIVGGAIGQHRFEAPEDCITVRRVAWHDESGTIKELVRSDQWDFDNLGGVWGMNRSTPKFFTDATLPSQVFEVMPAPTRAGYFQIVYLAIETSLSNSGIRVSVPDELSPYLKWGALADCLSKAGPAQDLIRAAYCEERFAEGLGLAKVMLLGGSDE